MFYLSKTCKDRNDIPLLLNALGLTGLAVEVGVWRGDYSYRIMERWKGDHLFLVDPWRKLPKEEYDDIRNEHYDPRDFEFVQERFKEFNTAEKSRVSLVVATSQHAIDGNLVPNSLDFVYIDGNHKYEYVMNDLCMWYFKLKGGGVLAGHDLFSLDHPDVTQAVCQFADDMGLKVEIVLGDYDENRSLVNAHSYLIHKE